MGDWVTNRLVIKDKEEKVKEVLDFIKGESYGEPSDVDFNKILPMPEELRDDIYTPMDDYYYAYYLATRGEYEEINEILKEGQYIHSSRKNSHQEYESIESLMKHLKERDPDIFEKGKRCHELNIKYGIRSKYEWSINNWGTTNNASRVEKIENGISFETNSAGVPDLILKLSTIFTDILFDYKYANQGGAIAGKYLIKNGELIMEEETEYLSDEAFSLSVDILGFDYISEVTLLDEQLERYVKSH